MRAAHFREHSHKSKITSVYLRFQPTLPCSPWVGHSPLATNAGSITVTEDLVVSESQMEAALKNMTASLNQHLVIKKCPPTQPSKNARTVLLDQPRE